MSNPTILLVGGAWHTADYLDPLAKVFEKAGYPTVALGLPSVGASPPAPDFSIDVNAIREIVQKLIADKKEIIAVFHSLGGIPGTEALQGLGQVPESSVGVTALVYIACHLPATGNSFDSHLEALGDESWKQAKQGLSQGGMIALPPEFALGMLYNDLPEDQAKHWASLLQPQSTGVYESPITYATYKSIPSGYLLTSNDQAFKYDYQLKTVEMAGFPKEMTLTVDTGHTPFLTKPEVVKEFILRVAGGGKK